MSDPHRQVWFTLARMLHMSVAQCQGAMSSSEFAEWKYLLEVDPPPDVKRAKEAASICASVQSAAGKRCKVSDFELKYKPRRQLFTRETASAIRDKLRLFLKPGG